MKNVYRVLAFAIAAVVLFQAAVIAFQFFRLIGFVGRGGTLDKATVENGAYPGATGALLHSFGANAIALLALALLVVAFFAKIPGGVKWAVITFVLVLVQWALAFLAYAAPSTGFLHGINALALFAMAGMTGARVRRATAAPAVTVG